MAQTNLNRQLTESEVLEFIRERLSAKFRIERLILFGSRATGKARLDSDYDVLVIARTRIPFLRRQAKARAVLWPRNFSLDLLVYNPAEARTAASFTGSAIYWALKEGKDFSAIG